MSYRGDYKFSINTSHGSMRCILCLFVVVSLLVFSLFISPAYAQGEKKWSMSLLLGGHLPDLKPLSDGLYKAPLIGNAEILLYEGTTLGESALPGDVIDENITEEQPFVFENEVPAVGVGMQAGLEFQWHANERHSLILGLGSMEKTSINRVFANLPLQQYFVSNTVFSERRDKISYTEYTLGWRYNLVRKPKYHVYSRLLVHEVFDIDFREDFVFRFVSSPIEDLVDVRRVMIVEAQRASVLMGQIGVGAEWFIRDWLSIGGEVGLLMGRKKFKIGNVSIKDDFLDTDNVFRNGLPYRVMSDGSLGYLKAGTTPEDVVDPATRENFYTPISLSFSGFRAMIRINFYY